VGVVGLSVGVAGTVGMLLGMAVGIAVDGCIGGEVTRAASVDVAGRRVACTTEAGGAIAVGLAAN